MTITKLNRGLLAALALLVVLGAIPSPLRAEIEPESEAKKEQRKSGGELLKFFFGDDEEDEEEDDKDEAQPEDDPKAAPAAAPSDAVQPAPEPAAKPLQAEEAPVTQQPLEEPAASQGTMEETAKPAPQREGLPPPPGFIEEPSDEETVQQVPAPTEPPVPAKPSVDEEKKIVVEEVEGLPAQVETTPEPGTPPVSEPGGLQQELARLEEENPVVAEVEGEEIYWRDIMREARRLPAQYQGQLETMFPILLDRAIDLKLLALAGRDADVDEHEEVRHELSRAEDRIIRDAYLKQRLDEMITEPMIRERYFELLRDNITNAEIHARHILVDTRNEALALVVALQNGADFPLLAKKFSRGPSAAKGGDLGWFRRKDMAPEFADAAFDLAVGEFTKVPVSTEFGWHVIKVEDKRRLEQPTYESMREEIREQISRDLITKMVRELRQEADVRVFPAR